MLGLGLSLTNVSASGGAGYPTASDYFAPDGSTFPLYGVATNPAALYDATANKTFITYERWDGIQRVCQVDTYDHALAAWGSSVTAGESVLHNDDHGAPAIAQSPAGYLFTFFGPHSNKLRIRASVTARSAAAWNVLTDLGSVLTYPHPVFVSTDLHMFARAEIGASNKMTLVHYKAASVTSNTLTWGSSETLVDYGTDTRFYIGNVTTGPDGYVWIIGTRSNFGDNWRRNVYLYRYNPANGDIENLDGSVVVTIGSQPILLATADASFALVTTNATGTGNIPQMCWDSANNFHLLYSDGVDSTSVYTYHMARPAAGGAFSTAQQLFYIRNRYNGYGIRASGTGVEMLAAVSANGDRGGDMYKITRTSGAVYSSATLVRAMDTNEPLETPMPVKDGLAALSWILAECSGGTANSNGSISDDTYAGYQRVFAYGSGGFVQKSPDPIITLNRTNIKAGLATGDLVAHIQSRQPREALTLNDPSGQFALSGRNLVTAGALTPGSYPITITSVFRGLTTIKAATIVIAAAVDVTDIALARFDFAEGSGQTITDASGNGLSGYLGTSAGDSTADLARVATGLENNTAGQLCAIVDYQPVMNQAAAIHIFAPVKLLTALGSAETIVSRRNGLLDESVFTFDITNGFLRWTSYNINRSSVATTAPSATVALNTWTLLEAEISGTSVILRQDGATVHTATISTAMVPNNSAPMIIGATKSAAGAVSSSLRGDLGCLHIYPRALSAGDATSERNVIKALMTARGVTLP